MQLAYLLDVFVNQTATFNIESLEMWKIAQSFDVSGMKLIDNLNCNYVFSLTFGQNRFTQAGTSDGEVSTRAPRSRSGRIAFH